MNPFLLLGTIILTFLTARMAGAQSPDAATTVITVDSPAFIFSPGNWTGDQGRGGSVFRQSWYPGAYFRVTWTTANANPSADLLLDTSTLASQQNKPQITYNIDGVWTDAVPCSTNDIKINGLKNAGTHTLSVYFKTSDQVNRWGSANESGKNVLRITGLQVDGDSKPETQPPVKQWALIVGDSITEGSAADFGKAITSPTGRISSARDCRIGAMNMASAPVAGVAGFGRATIPPAMFRPTTWSPIRTMAPAAPTMTIKAAGTRSTGGTITACSMPTAA